MDSKQRKMERKTVLSMAVLISFCFIAGSSLDDIVHMIELWIGVIILIGICALIYGSMKSKARKNMESSMVDFKITSSVLIDDDCAVYFDAKQEKIRIASIGLNSCHHKDINNIEMGKATFFPTDSTVSSSEKIFAIENRKDQSVILAQVDSDKFKVGTIEKFEPSVYVSGTRKSFFAIDKKNENILIIHDFSHHKIISFEDIIKVELIESGRVVSSKSSMRTIGGAALGGVIAGGAGMVVGGLSGKTTSAKEIDGIKVKLLLRDIENPEITIMIYDLKINLDKDYDVYKRVSVPAHKIVDLVSVIIDNIDNKSKKNNVELTTEKPIEKDIVEELQKLASLKEQGILSDDEFSKLKERLLQS